MSDGKVTGACSCGGVRFEADFPSRFVAHCHCENCRRAHGAAFVTFAGFKDAQFRVTEGTGLLADYATETGATRSFCRTCGSTLLYRSPRWEGEVHVVVGNIDGALDREPQAHVYADRSPAWHTIGDALPKLGGATGTEKLD